MLIDFCKTSSGLRVFLILKYIINIIFIIVPIILIVGAIISIAKTFSKTDDIGKLVGLFIKRLIAAMVIYLLPSLFGYIFGIVDENNMYNLNQCFNKSNLEEISYYEDTYERIESLVSDLEQNPNKNKVEQVKNEVMSSKDLRGEDKEDFIVRIDASETKVDEYKKIAECKRKHGKYENGYCKIPVIPKKQKQEESSESDYYSTGSGTTVDYNDYKVAQTQISLDSFMNYISRNKVAENKDISRYSGYCLGFAYTHAYSYYVGDTSINAEDGKNYKYAGRFSTYINDSKEDVLSKVYNEISNGKPCIIQVNGNKEGTSRHFVAVVGVKKTATASNIKETDLLIIDSYDGKLESMNGKGSGTRFMISGKDCHKDYTGYRMQYIK